jgi:hypothetical protein
LTTTTLLLLISPFQRRRCCSPWKPSGANGISSRRRSFFGGSARMIRFAGDTISHNPRGNNGGSLEDLIEFLEILNKMVFDFEKNGFRF